MNSRRSPSSSYNARSDEGRHQGRDSYNTGRNRSDYRDDRERRDYQSAGSRNRDHRDRDNRDYRDTRDARDARDARDTRDRGRERDRRDTSRPQVRVTLKTHRASELGDINTNLHSESKETSTNKRKVAPVSYKENDDGDELSELDMDDAELDAQLDELIGNSEEEVLPAKSKRKSTARSRSAKRVRKDYDDEDEEYEEPTPVPTTRPQAVEEDEDEEDENVEMDEEDEEDEDEDDRMINKLGAPDTSKLTARQRAKLEEDGSNVHEGLGYEALDALEQATSAASRRKIHLTEEEQALKRAEMARRRKNMSIKRLEEEKQETLDKLLKKRASRSRKIISAADDSAVSGPGTPGMPMGLENGGMWEGKRRVMVKHAALMSWRSTRDGFSLSFEPEILESRPI